MSRSKKSHSVGNKKSSSQIVINEAEGLVFTNEDDLYNHFIKEIETLEAEFLSHRSDNDFSEEEFTEHETNLTTLLDEPDEVWLDKSTVEGSDLYIYIKWMNPSEDENEVAIYHVAVCYLTGDVPTFVYLHFPTKDDSLVERYRRGELIFDRSLLNIPIGAIEGDALTENDELATGLFDAMLTLRSEKDLSESEFQHFADLRENTLEEADEIWRSTDSMGNVLVSFVKEFHDIEGFESLYYIVVTLEDTPSNSHALLFSFPTTDKSLVERYRHGENLQAEEVVQEASH